MNLVSDRISNHASERNQEITKDRTPRLLGNEHVKVSFEFYPPRTETMEQKLWNAIKRLEPLRPVDVAVTYGLGDETRARTRETTARILQETKLKVAAHITCASATREELNRHLNWYWSIGVRHIVALRGDAAVTSLQPDGYANSTELVRAVSKIAPFAISVAAYPEKHPDSPSMDDDIDNLKRKIDDGATHAITQYFFDNDVYFRFLDRVRAAGIQIPITPGILPIHNLHQVAQVAARCRVHIPHWLTRRLQDIDDAETRRVAAAAHSAEQVLDLVDRGVQHVHFFTLNRADLVYGICHMIGLRASSEIY